jgi:hypothetical protein
MPSGWFPEMQLAGGVHGEGVTGSGFGFKTFVSKSDITLCVVRGPCPNGPPKIYMEFVSSILSSVWDSEIGSLVLAVCGQFATFVIAGIDHQSHAVLDQGDHLFDGI